MLVVSEYQEPGATAWRRSGSLVTWRSQVLVRAVGGGVLRGGLEESGEEIARVGAGGGGTASCERAREPGRSVWRWRGEGNNGARWMRSRADESRERSFLFKSRERGLRLNHTSGFVLALSF